MNDKLLESILTFVLNNMGNREMMHLNSYLDSRAEFWQEIQKLKADREVLVWALKFYADPLSYRTIETKLDHYPTILNECEHINHRLCGGKRARQALKSIGEIE